MNNVLYDINNGVVSHHDTTGQQRIKLVANPKTIANAAATSLFTLACPAGAMVGGSLDYIIQATDGTDYQALQGFVTFSAVNKAGTITATITEVAGNQGKAVSAGTLTVAWTIVAGTNLVTIKVQPTTSLTITVTPFTVTYSIYPMVGQTTLL
jgi:hypothetical protein